ncbi:MAG: PPC domain-containing DNA-binding protein [Desulfosarcina sp.]
MKSKCVNDGDEKTFVLILDEGDEPITILTDFARNEKISAGKFTAIGAFKKAVVGYYDMSSQEYKKISVDEQVEVLSLIGDIACHEDHPKVHAHVVLGRSDSTVRGGHLIEARVRPTLEIVLVESPEYLRRKMDPRSGLALIEL